MMLYALKIAGRYLGASRGQTALLISGVAVGVFVFVFISALIGGLGSYLVLRTVGDISHVTLTAAPSEAGLLLGQGRQALVVTQAETGQRDLLRGAEAFLPQLEAERGIKGVSPQISGNGFVLRGQARAAVAVTGVEPDKISAIADIDGRLVAGSSRLGANRVLIGRALADDLRVEVGQILRLQSDRNVELSLQIEGIFELGLESLDKRAAFVSLPVARKLFAVSQGLSRIEIKLDDLNDAEPAAKRLAAMTGFQADPWTSSNAQLLQGLTAQAQSSNLIKAFSMITIVIGVASALLLSTYRRSSEIGIMRAFGAKRSFVIWVFVLQGSLIGLIGGVVGAGLGYGLLSQFPPPMAGQAPGFPVDYRQGAYGLAIVLTTLGAIVASILPARAASKIDPVKVIGQ